MGDWTLIAMRSTINAATSAVRLAKHCALQNSSSAMNASYLNYYWRSEKTQVSSASANVGRTYSCRWLRAWDRVILDT